MTVVSSAARKTRPPTSIPALKIAPLVAPTTPVVPCELKLTQLKPSPTNPRKSFDPLYLDSLADSIRQVGVLERLLVRPIAASKKGGVIPQLVHGAWVGVDHYEIVCGECRYRASRIAKRDIVRVDIMDLTDEQVRVIQLIENVQRKDLSISDEAAGYEALVKEGQSPEQIATNTGKKLPYVRGMLKLARLVRLVPEVLKAVDSGRLPRIVAELVARVPAEEACQTLAKCVLAGQRWWKPGDKPPTPKDGAEVLTVRETKSLIAECFQLELKKAPFDRKALDLVEGTTSCERCPKRAGNAAVEDEAYKEIRADMCLDPACYRKKEQAHQRKQVEAAATSGQKVLTAKQSGGLFNSWDNRLSYHSPYVELDGKCYEDSRNRSYQTLLKEHLKPDQVVIAVDQSGRPHELVDKATAAKILRDHHQLGVKANTPNRSPADAKRAQEQKEWAAVRRRGQELAAAAAERLIKVNPGSGPWGDVLHAVCVSVVDEFWGEVVTAARKRRQGRSDRPGELVDLTGAEAFGLIAELSVAKALSYPGEDRTRHKLLFKVLGIDLDAIKAEVKKGDQVEVKKAPEKGTSARTPKKTAEQQLQDLGLLSKPGDPDFVEVGYSNPSERGDSKA
ncbi:MAG: hypothetical protein JWO38_4894 [Gemmataceae bacterium]|nr:hypothetical protein [Gemmataceae bacterium]